MVERKIMKKKRVNDMQFGLKPGKGPTNASFTVRQTRNMGIKERNDTMLFIR